MTHTTAPGRFSADDTVTLSELASLLGRDIKTIKTWRAADRWANAKQDKTGRKTWHVPVTDLVAAGDLDAALVGQVENELAARRESKATRELREQVIRLQEQLAAATVLAEERAGTIALLKALVRKGGAA